MLEGMKATDSSHPFVLDLHRKDPRPHLDQFLGRGGDFLTALHEEFR